MILKRLIGERKLIVDDYVKFKKHPYDSSIYQIKEILPNDHLFIDNGINSYTNINPSSVERVNK